MIRILGSLLGLTLFAVANGKFSRTGSSLCWISFVIPMYTRGTVGGDPVPLPNSLPLPYLGMISSTVKGEGGGGNLVPSYRINMCLPWLIIKAAAVCLGV